MIRRFAFEIQEFADQFIYLQSKREHADYDPAVVLEQSDVILDIENAEQCIVRFENTLERDRRAFAVYVLLNLRNG